ncbi:MAG: hypothetical protein Q9172_006154 [Xanthocarpia lactea]
MPLFEQNIVPTYLIRVYAPNSAGQTTRSYVIPPASNLDQFDLMQDIFTLPQQKAATRLNEHFRWDRSHENRCNLMSWTSSLLFALQYGLYKHRGNHSAKPDLSKISLLLLDTRGLPEGTFVKDLEIMETFGAYSDPKVQKNLKDFLKFRKDNRGYYFGEYLTQGDIDIRGKCVVTNMQRLIDVGLFELIPNLGDERTWTMWPKRVLELRKPFETSEHVPTIATHAEVRDAITIAVTCFGGRWVFPVATMLLALESRRKKDPVIVKDEIEQLQLNKIKTDTYKLPEVKQFQSLIDDIFQRFTGGEVDHLSRILGSVDLGSVDHEVSAPD